TQPKRLRASTRALDPFTCCAPANVIDLRRSQPEKERLAIDQTVLESHVEKPNVLLATRNAFRHHEVVRLEAEAFRAARICVGNDDHACLPPVGQYRRSGFHALRVVAKRFVEW